MNTAKLALFLLFLPLPVMAAEKPKAAESVYSDISGEQCKQVEFDEDIGRSLMRCPGVAGFQLDLEDFDARMTLGVVTPDGKSHPLDFSQVITSGFSALGDQAEWRLVDGRPQALDRAAQRFGESRGFDPDHVLPGGRQDPGWRDLRDRQDPALGQGQRGSSSGGRRRAGPALLGPPQ